MDTAPAVNPPHADAAREAWLAARRQHVTATDAPKILGLSKWGGPTSVYFDKVPDPSAPNEIPPERLARMTWGRRLEEAIIAAFAERTEQEVALADPYTLITCAEHPLLACSLDAWIPGSGVPVDAKNIRFYDADKWGEDGTDEIPDDYTLQLTVQMMCQKADLAYLPVLFSGQDLKVFHAEYDPDMASMIVDAAEDFWRRYVLTGTPPPPDGSDTYSEHLAKALRQKSADIIPVTDPTVIEWATALREAREAEAEAAKIRVEAEQNLKERIGTAAGIVGPGFRITWKESKGSEKTDWEQMARALHATLTKVEQFIPSGDAEVRALEDVIKQFTRTTPGSRRFTPKFTEAEE